jgi:17beta-estradiol 17-dehydrogenase / very-long-chain 3-oxoacyl-CoA reductase
MLHKLLSSLSDSLRFRGPAVQAVVVVFVLLLGIARCVGSASALIRFFWRQFLRPAQNLTRYGKWAIVTGATDGIGREYCNVLAKMGTQLCTRNHFAAR